ncbi:MAG: hypothetical protein JWR16_2677 [Nevskia sp.]|nr:hypothetical protein [Nevskia sp.]
MQPVVQQNAVVARIASIDLMRGIIMLIMAIDHVRDFTSPFPYDPTDLSQASAGLFLTRWITHFCAPTFMFLAGTSAFLYARNTGVDRAGLQRFLVTRGLWLVFLEVSWNSFMWRFAFDGIQLQVLWALGWAMVWLALMLYLPLRGIVAVALILVFGHNLFDGIHPQDFGGEHTVAGWAWAIVHEPLDAHTASGFEILAFYPLVPWIGVMSLGYAFGQVLQQPALQRARFMHWTGLSMIALFLLLRLTNFYGDQMLWQSNPRGALYTALDVLDVSKYPPSLQYLLMTLGLVLLLLPSLESARGRFAQAISVFGRVPMFFYLLHVPLIHGIGVIGQLALYGKVTNTLRDHPALPDSYEPSLLRMYAVWLLVVLLLYPLCRWYADYKRRHKEQWWLSYL